MRADPTQLPQKPSMVGKIAKPNQTKPNQTKPNQTKPMRKENIEDRFEKALDDLVDSSIWKLLGRAEKHALENPPLYCRSWGNPDGHEGINRRLERVKKISDKFAKRFIARRMEMDNGDTLPTFSHID